MNTYIGSAKYEYVTSLRSSWTTSNLSSAVHDFSPAAGQQVPEFHLDDGGVAARFVVFGLLHDHRIPADHHDVAGADFLCDFHDVSERVLPAWPTAIGSQLWPVPGLNYQSLNLSLFGRIYQ